MHSWRRGSGQIGRAPRPPVCQHVAGTRGLLQTRGRHVHRVTAAHSTDGGWHVQDPCVLLWLCPCSSPSGRGRAWLVHSCPIAAGHVRPCRSGPGPRSPFAVTAATCGRSYMFIYLPYPHPRPTGPAPSHGLRRYLRRYVRAARPPESVAATGVEIRGSAFYRNSHQRISRILRSQKSEEIVSCVVYLHAPAGTASR